MVQSRRRTSLLGMLALIVGAAALVLAKFNPTGIETVPNLPVTLRLSTAAAIAATALGLIAFLAAASSARTGAGLPFGALLVGVFALLLAWKPNLLTMIHPSAPAPAKSTPAVSAQAPRNRRRRKNLSIESKRSLTLTSRRPPRPRRRTQTCILCRPIHRTPRHLQRQPQRLSMARRPSVRHVRSWKRRAMP